MYRLRSPVFSIAFKQSWQMTQPYLFQQAGCPCRTDPPHPNLIVINREQDWRTKGASFRHTSFIGFTADNPKRCRPIRLWYMRKRGKVNLSVLISDRQYIRKPIIADQGVRLVANVSQFSFKRLELIHGHDFASGFVSHWRTSLVGNWALGKRGS